MTPIDAACSVCARTFAIVFGKIDRFFIAWIALVIPAFAVDMRADLALDVNRTSVWAPRSAEKHVVMHSFTGQFAADENQSAWLDCGKTHRRGDVAIGLAVQCAVFKNGGRLSENKICGALDLAIIKVLSAHLGVKRILPA